MLVTTISGVVLFVHIQQYIVQSAVEPGTQWVGKDTSQSYVPANGKVILIILL